jgi:hypothetical protein
VVETVVEEMEIESDTQPCEADEKEEDTTVEVEVELSIIGVVGRGVRASREVIVGNGTLRFGIWAKQSPTWSWFVGGSGKVLWTVGGKDLPLRYKRNAAHATRRSRGYWRS